METAILTPALGIIDKLLGLLKPVPELQKCVVQYHELRIQYLEEESLGYESNDRRMEELRQKIKIELETIDKFLSIPGNGSS